MTKIFYFSGTGNSLWSAKKISQEIGGDCELFNIGKEAQKDNIEIEAQTIVFVFPSYAYGLPLVVRRFIKKAGFKADYLAAFVTFGSNQGGTLGDFRRIIKRKNIKKFYFGQIPAVENYLAIFGAPKPEVFSSRIKMQEEATLEAAKIILEKRENKVSTFTPFTYFVWLLFSLGVKIFYIFYEVGKKCNGCGICEKICPVGAIVMKKGRPSFTKACEHCQGCIDMCPSRAIQFSGVRFGKPGYRHPQIEIQELFRQAAVNGSVS